MAKKKTLKIILDTNWYVSATINRNSRRRLYSLLTNENLVIYYSNELLAEYASVISRKKFERYITIRLVRKFIELVLNRLNYVEIKTQAHLSRDVNDNFLLAMSVDCAADYLVTGDPDLLDLKEFEKTKIVTMAEFLKITS